MKIQDLITALEQQALVITPNRRLATHLIKIYNQHQQQKRKLVWQSPLILTVAEWLEQQWVALQESKVISFLMLLNARQALVCWQRIIKNSSWNHDLMKLEDTASLAYEAWKTLQNWNITLDQASFNFNLENQAFFDWASCYQKENDHYQRCDNSLIPNLLIQHNQYLKLPKLVVLACFDEITPALQRLFNILENKTKLIHYDSALSSDVRVLACSDQELELKQMTQWAHEQLGAGLSSIGCVIPNLNQQRTAIERIFNQVFPDRTQFNISGGQAFTTFPVIYHAFNLLQLLNSDIYSLTLISQILRSPYIGNATTEKFERALFDDNLHMHGELYISRHYLINWSKQKIPLLSQLLVNGFDLKYASLEKPSNWANYFSQFLASLGWPGEQGLNSEEYQVVQRWLLLLSEFANLDSVIETLSLDEALSQLHQLAIDTLFQIQSKDAPIQILGMLEAAGITFDALWIMGLDDEKWPGKANPNPFIPLPLQRKFNMPHATAAREMDFSRVLTKRFASSALSVIFSYAKNDGDRILRPSSLINSYPISTSEDLNRIETSANELLSQEIEFIEDNLAPIVTSDEKISGGSQILKLQSNCPFQAFASIRLGAVSIDEPHLGLNALQRGVLIHRILELIWQELKTHQQLCTLSKDQLTTIITKIVSDNLTAFKLKWPHNLTTRFLQLEQQRLVNLIEAWLELEKQRPPFTVISQEAEQSITLANIHFKLRSDRIDQLANGEKIIIDYKTAKTSIHDWFGERLDEPQLPLYHLCDEEIAGLVFAQVRIDELGFKGVANSDTNIPGVIALGDVKNPEAQSNWQSQNDTWREQLTKLAEDFAHGNASLDPKHKAETCARCDLKSLCRIASYG